MVVSLGYNKVVFCNKNICEKDDINKLGALTIAQKVNSMREISNFLQESNTQRQRDYNFIVICGPAVPGPQVLGSHEGKYDQLENFFYNSSDEIEEEVSVVTQSLDTTKPVKPVLFLAGGKIGLGKDGDLLLTKLSRKIRNTLVVAPTDDIAFRPHCMGDIVSSVSLLKVVMPEQPSLQQRGVKTSTDPVEFKYAFNGKVITEEKIPRLAGVRSDLLFGELLKINNEL
jgi:hypothetical protein